MQVGAWGLLRCLPMNDISEFLCQGKGKWVAIQAQACAGGRNHSSLVRLWASQVSFIVVSFLPDSTLEKRIGREEEETHLRHPHTRISVGLYLFSVNDNGTMLPWISGGKLWDVYKLEEGELVLQLLMVWCVKCLLSNRVSSVQNGLIFRKHG